MLLLLLFFCLLWILGIILISNQILLFITVSLMKKHVTLYFSRLKMKKYLDHVSLFFCLSGISLGRYLQNSVVKSEGRGKNKKGGLAM